MSYVIGTDIGATNARIAIKWLDTGREESLRCDGFSLEQIETEDISKRINSLIMPQLSQHKLAVQDCAGICFGAAGVDTQEVKELTQVALLQMGFAPKVCVVYNDCEVILRAGGKADIFVAAGTGAIVLAINERGEALRRSGWGHFTSDAGSGSYVALQALRYAASVWDESSEGNAFTKALTQSLGVSTPLELEQIAINSAKDKSRLASIAPLVCEYANGKDECLREILKTSAAALCNSTLQLAKALGLKQPRIMLWGSMLLKCDYLRTEMLRLLQEQTKPVIVQAEYSALEAALILAEDLANAAKIQ